MSTLSTTVVANMALSLLGVAPVLNIGDDQEPAKVMNLWYDPTRDEVIRGADWTFARARATLARLTDAPLFGWDYQYQLPVNPKCLMVKRLIEDSGYIDLNVSDSLYTGLGSVYEIESDKLLTNYDTASIIFLRRVTDTTKFDALFVKALVYKLANDACFDITGSLDRTAGLSRNYEHILNVASGRSAQEHFRTADANNAWVNAGHGGLPSNALLNSRLNGG